MLINKEREIKEMIRVFFFFFFLNLFIQVFIAIIMVLRK